MSKGATFVPYESVSLKANALKVSYCNNDEYIEGME